MKQMFRLFLCLILALGVVPLIGCAQEDSSVGEAMEDAADEVEEAVDEAADAVDEAMGDAEGAMDETADEMEDAAEGAGSGS
ncbi:MAG: hypothetical protein R3325_12920 [Thermoanaerobaculia bacterium]|nr:hypothetical protein [Thermoanaerobaculia bacterium]